MMKGTDYRMCSWYGNCELVCKDCYIEEHDLDWDDCPLYGIEQLSSSNGCGGMCQYCDKADFCDKYYSKKDEEAQQAWCDEHCLRSIYGKCKEGITDRSRCDRRVARIELDRYCYKR